MSEQPQIKESEQTLLPVILVSAGVVVIWICAFLGREALGALQYGIYLGGLVALVGVVWFRRKISSAEIDLDAKASQVVRERSQVVEERSQLDELRQEIESQLEEQTARIEKREQALSHQLIAYREWMEYPQPDDEGPSEESADEQLQELAKKDRQVIELLESESKRIFENIRNNKYGKEGRFHPSLFRDDALELMTRVAHIYQPDAENPLLETSIEQLARAASRACLHFLIVLEQLPLNVKEYNINSLYGYLRQAVKAYGMYKTVEPYLAYINSGFYLGRYLMGGSPVSLGAWWAVGELGKRGAKAVTTRVINRQAVALLHDMIRVVGYEVAGIYGGDFRHRDANWIYGAELTHLMCRFPISRENLAHALKEIGVLQLRNEYDRIYLYRCLAVHKSAEPRLIRAGYLSVEERQQIVQRLEKFFDAFIHGKTPKRVDRWKGDVEERFDLKLAISTEKVSQAAAGETEEAIRSLTGFLLESKNRKMEELPDLLKELNLYTELDEEYRERLLHDLQADPPYYFEPADLDPSGEVVQNYLEDLAKISVRIPPPDPSSDEMLIEVASYFRQSEKSMQGILDKQYVDSLEERLAPDAPTKRLPADVVRAILSLLGPDESPQFAYSDVSLEWPEDVETEEDPSGELWLFGTRRRLVVFAQQADPRLLWSDGQSVEAERVGGYLIDDCRLSGGRWHPDPQREVPAIRVKGAMIGSYEAHFKPLLAFLGE